MKFSFHVSDAVELKCEVPTITGGTVSPTSAISPGASYSVTCNSGFTLKGSATVSCTESNGQATLSNLPTCEKGWTFCTLSGQFSEPFLCKYA